MENQTANSVSEADLTVINPIVQPKNNNFLIILLSILLFISILIAGFFAYQTQKLINELTSLKSEEKLVAVATTDPAANWKTYTDDEYKFSFKYPVDWELRCVAAELPDGWLDRNICDLVSPKAMLNHGQIENGLYLVVGVSKPNPNYSNFSEYLTYSSKQYGYVYKDKKINNISGKVALTNGKETNYLFEKNGHIFNVSWIYSEKSEMVDQILSTFKFTDSDPTANWKTYTNTKLGFEIKYPASVKVDKEFNDQYNRATEFTGKDINFTIMLRSGYGIDIKNYFFMDSPISGTTTLARVPANIYKLPNGYCDGPSCSAPYIAIVTVNGPDLYHLSFFGDSELSNMENQILSTFKFTN